MEPWANRNLTSFACQLIFFWEGFVRQEPRRKLNSRQKIFCI